MTASTFIARLIASLPDDHARALRSTATRQPTVVHRDHADAIIYRTLKRSGLVSMTRPDKDGNAQVYRTTMGEEVVAALPAPARRRRVQPVAQAMTA